MSPRLVYEVKILGHLCSLLVKLSPNLVHNKEKTQKLNHFKPMFSLPRA
jgi:hypothetical protein